jgi:hypothetical protein
MSAGAKKAEHRWEWIVRAVTLVIAVAVTVAGVWWLTNRHRSHPDCQPAATPGPSGRHRQ